MGEFVGVADRTMRNWRHRHAEFNDALQIGKDAADARVERSLYQRAVGYSFDAEKIMQDKGVVVRADYVEHLPPDVSAAQYWLNNRKGYRSEEHKSELQSLMRISYAVSGLK